LLFILVINTIRSFQVFIEIYVMTKGGPLGSTSTVVYFVFDEGLQKFNMGYASAAAYLLFVIIHGISADWHAVSAFLYVVDIIKRDNITKRIKPIFYK